MKTPAAVAALGALAHEHRLSIFRLLIARGPEGLPAGRIAERMGLVPSSLTFHKAFKELETRIKLFISLPIASLDQILLQETLRAIGKQPASVDA